MRAWPVLVVAAACSGGEPDLMDYAGRYNVFVDGIIGCDNDPAYVEWLEGPLQIRGAPSDATFDFGPPFVLSGSTTPAGAVSFGGVIEDGDTTWFTSGSGEADGEPQRWVITGEAGAEVDEDGDPSTNCTITALYTARQIAE